MSEHASAARAGFEYRLGTPPDVGAHLDP
jgi:hypothetical protein